MTSSSVHPRMRKRPEERRAEILSEAAKIALEEGLEKITLRAIADRLGVRPGLITHYFPVADDLVVAAFVLAVSGEREKLMPADGTPIARLARMVDRAEGEDSWELARLWLNARHLSRFRPSLASALEEQEALDRARLIELIEEGIRTGSFAPCDPTAVCIELFVVIDGVGSYVNNTGDFSHETFSRLVSSTAARLLGLEREQLRAAIAGSGPEVEA